MLIPALRYLLVDCWGDLMMSSLRTFMIVLIGLLDIRVKINGYATAEIYGTRVLCIGWIEEERMPLFAFCGGCQRHCLEPPTKNTREKEILRIDTKKEADEELESREQRHCTFAFPVGTSLRYWHENFVNQDLPMEMGVVIISNARHIELLQWLRGRYETRLCMSLEFQWRGSSWRLPWYQQNSISHYCLGLS